MTVPRDFVGVGLIGELVPPPRPLRAYWDYPVVTFEPPPLPEIAAVDPELRAVYAEAVAMVLGPSVPDMGELLDAVEWDWPPPDDPPPAFPW